MHKFGSKARSKTGCRTCRIRKVKCDEEKIYVVGQDEPQCRRCTSARILCEWKGGPIPRKSSSGSNRGQLMGENRTVRKWMHFQAGPYASIPLLPARDSGDTLQAANSLFLTNTDRSFLDYLQGSALVLLLGKHWPWSTISYIYHRIAVREPMVMSMVLATAASEFHRSRLLSEHVSVDDLSDVEGRSHYGKALSGLREVLKQEVKSPEQIEAIFITLWLMGDYENRFGSGSAGINVHIKGITSLLFNHIMPLLKPRQQGPPPAISMGESSAKDHPTEGLESQPATSATEKPDGKLRYTSVPLFLLWTLYLFNPGTIFYGPGCANANIGLLRLFLCAEPGGTNLSLPELYRISRQSPSHFWGDGYPATAHLDDLENLPGLGLYHRSHVTQFRITELYRQHSFSDVGVQSPFQQIVDEISAIAKEFDILLSFAKAAPSYEIAGEGRRVMETVYWSSMNYYSTIVYFHLCFMDVLKEQPQCLPPQILSLDEAASLVLELALKLHRSRPRAMIRTFWPLFIAGIATRDQIYKDWVSTRLRELTRYGQNYGRVSDRFDEITQGHDSFAYARKYLSTLHQN